MFQTAGCSARWRFFLALLCALALLPSVRASSAQGEGTALLLTIDGAIGPATVDYFTRGLHQAEASHDRVLIIQLDTPGGLGQSMHDMIKAILASPVPVITYVSPDGARAASAGTYLMYASHIAAMAPSTHLGSATPVQISLFGGLGGSDADKKQGGSAMEHKITEDAVAYIRSLAQRRDRNAGWAEKAVRQAANLTASEALKNNVIDVVAPNIRDLLQQVNGRKVMMADQARTLHTANLTIKRFDPDWRTRLLSVISNPEIAYFLLLAGILGLVLELLNPGVTVPGVVGGICLILALFAFQMLTVDYSGLALVLLGLGFIIAEAFVPTFGILGIGGIIAFVSGSIILMNGMQQQVSIPLIGGVSLVAAGFLLWMVTRFIGLRRRAPVTGDSQMIGQTARVLEDFVPEGESPSFKGRVQVRGENWKALSHYPAKIGERLIVTGVHGLHLDVTPGEHESMPEHRKDLSNHQGDTT